VVAAAPLVVFAEALAGRRLLAPVDGYQHYLPLHVLAARVLRTGHLPVWNPFTFSGYPLLATNQAAVFYPPNLAFVVFPAMVANNGVVIADFVIAGTGAFLVSKRLCGDATGAMVSGLAFGLSGFMFAHVTHQSMLASVAWIPWVLWAYERLRERATVARLAVAGGALAFVALAGHSQMFFLALVVIGVYGVVLTIASRRERWRPPLLACATVVVGAGLSAVQLLPTASIVGISDRSKLDYAGATSYSLPLSHTPLLVFPYLFGNQPRSGPFTTPYAGAWELRELSGYVGAAALVLAAAGVAGWRRDRRIVALAAVGGVSLLVALGRSTPFGHVTYILPIAGHFRAWGRYLAGVDLAVALLAGYGVAMIGTIEDGHRARRAAVACAGAIVLAAAVVSRIGPVARHAVHGTPRAWALLLPVGAAIAAGVLASLASASRSRRRLVAGAIAALVAVDLVVSFGWFAEWRSASPSVGSVRAALAGRGLALHDVPHVVAGIERYADLSRAGSRVVRDQADLAALSGHHSVNGFDPLAPRDYLDAAGHMSYFGLVTRPDELTRPGSHVLDLLRVSVVVDDDPAGGPPRQWERATALPEVFVVGEAAHASRRSTLDAVHGRLPLRPDETAMLDRRCDRCRAARAPGPAGSAQVTNRRAGALDIDVAADRAGILVLSQAWFPGWHASVDGRPAPVTRVDGIVQGVPIGAGRHYVALRYRAPGLRTGAAVSAATAIALALAAVASARRRPPVR